MPMLVFCGLIMPVRRMFGAFLVLFVHSFARGIQLNPLHIMCVFNVCPDKLAALLDAFILVLVGFRGAVITFPNTGGNIIGHQLDKGVSRSSRQCFIRFDYNGFNFTGRF